MRLQELLAVFGENTKVEVFDKNTNCHLGKYDGKESFAEVLNHIKVFKATAIADELDVEVDFNPLKYFNSFPKVVAKNYIIWKSKTHILGTYESDYGTMYLDTENYLHTLDGFIYNVIVKDEEFIEYVINSLEKFDEERLNY